MHGRDRYVKDGRSVAKACAVAACAAVLLAVLAFLGGVIAGRRADGPTNADVCGKVETEAADLRARIDAANGRLGTLDSKIDILLNIATNAPGRDFAR